jgi:hypothetical protein
LFSSKIADTHRLDLSLLVSPENEKKLGNMLMTPVKEEPKKRRKKGESGESEEEEKARLLSEDPLDWIMKNEKVAGMLSVSSMPARRGKVLRAFRLANGTNVLSCCGMARARSRGVLPSVT